MSIAARLKPYLQVARLSHWVKNVFMLLGVLLAWFYRPEIYTVATVPTLLLAFLCTCIVASSNYVVNELLDAKEDRLNPLKQDRPAAQQRITGWIAVVEWLGLGALGVGLSWFVNPTFAAVALAFWLMGCVYNLPPLRTKNLPWLDVLTESVNNPIRLLLGWHALIEDLVPPLSLILAYWMIGAFFMATKRFAELRQIGDPATAATYRVSFRYYTEDRLLVSMVFYAVVAALFGGIFIVRYKLELILGAPLLAGFVAAYVRVGLKPQSPAQAPERLHLERAFVAFAAFTVIVHVLLMLTEIPLLYDLFNVEPSGFAPLWHLGE